jgi:hypothetical protein
MSLKYIFTKLNEIDSLQIKKEHMQIKDEFFKFKNGNYQHEIIDNLVEIA